MFISGDYILKLDEDRLHPPCLYLNLIKETTIIIYHEPTTNETKSHRFYQ